MKQSNLFIPTLKDSSTEGAEYIQLLLKGGYIRQVGSHDFAYLPLANRIIQKLELLLRAELRALDANELRFSVTNQLAQQESVLTDNQLQLVTDLALTDFSVIQLLSREIQSYRQLPLTFYQVQTIAVDEVKRMHSLLKETHELFVDGFFLHPTKEGREAIYQQLLKAISQFLSKCEIDFSMLTGDGIHALQSKVFIGDTENGYETVLKASLGSYAALQSLAISQGSNKVSAKNYLALEQIQSIEKDAPKLQIQLFKQAEKIIAVFMRQADELSIVKLHKVLATEEIVDFEGEKVFASLDDLLTECEIYADETVLTQANYLLADCVFLAENYQNVNLASFEQVQFVDLRLVHSGETAIESQGILEASSAVRIARVENMRAIDSSVFHVTNDENERVQIELGHFAMNLSEIFALIVDQKRVGQKMSWPRAIAPFDVHLIAVEIQDYYQEQLMQFVEEKLIQANYEVLVDDREERIGVKFAEADLIGCPIRIVVGKKAADQVVELEIMSSQSKVEVRLDDLLGTLEILLAQNAE